MRSTNSAAEAVASSSARVRGERGATIVEFLGVMLLTVVGLMVVIQMSLWIWARDITMNAADEGARAAAEVGRPLGVGEARARSVLHDGLGGAAARFQIAAGQDGETVVVRAVGIAPQVVPFLPAFEVSAEARSTCALRAPSVHSSSV